MLIDLSHILTSGTPAYPGDPPLVLEQTASLKQDHFVSYHLATGLHTGTHLDAPMHLVEDSRFAADFPPDAFTGQGVLLDVSSQPVIDYQPRYETLVAPHSIVLLYTGWDASFGTPEYFKGHPVISPAFCDFLIRRQIKMLGMDFPSPDYPPFLLHKKLLRHTIFLLENLTNLQSLKPYPHFEVYAFPLRLQAEASPVRAVCRVESSD